MECVNNATNCDPFEIVEPPSYHYHIPIIFKILSFLLFFGGFFGNLLVVVILSLSFSQLNTVDTLLLNLACGDLIGSITLPLILFIYLTREFGPGHSGCTVFGILSETCISLTVTSLLIAVWHFGRNVIIRPSVGDLKRRSLRILIIASWVVASFTSWPGCLLEVHHQLHTGLMYVISLFAFQSLLPIFIFTFIFVRIGITITQAGFALEESQGYVKDFGREESQGNNDLGLEELQENKEFWREESQGVQAVETEAEEGISLMEEQRISNKRKAYLLLANVFAFYLIILPYQFAQFWYLLDLGNLRRKPHQYLFDLYLSFQMLICAKFATNPLIYAFLYDTFRDGLKRLMRMKRKRYNFVNVRYNFRRDPEFSQQQRRMNGMEDGGNVYMSTTTDGMNEIDLGSKEDISDYDEDEIDRDDVAILR